MKTVIKIDETEKLIFDLLDGLKEDIEKKVVSSDSIKKFDVLSKDFKEIGEYFFGEFSDKPIDQIITYGSAISTSEICLLLKNNLHIAKSIGQNPIAAKRIVNREYLMFLQFITNSFKNIHKKRALSSDDLSTLNESVRTLIRLAEEDGIYLETELKLNDKKSQEILFSVIRESQKAVFS